jgi:hypothetical protein
MPTTAARLTLLAAALLAGSAGSVSARNSSIGFSFVSSHVVQGDAARVAVNVHPGGGSCALSVRYHDGTAQRGLAPARAAGGHAAWTWTVPTTVQAGTARATVRCTNVGTVSRSVMIVGRLLAPKITVKQQGFSTRPQLGGGTRLSYGLILHNEAPERDASKVVVQVNFVLADEHLLGTDSERISGIAAGSDYALGNTVSFPGAAPVVRLEVVIQVESFAPHTLHFPTLENIHLVPQTYDPRWLGSVEGELQNTDPVLTLRNAALSTVVFDSNGNIVGGGTGYAMQTLPPGAREFLLVRSGLDVIPAERAVTAMISMTPSWQQPGT